MTEPFKIESSAGRHPGQSVLHVSGAIILGTETQFLERVRAETAPMVILELTGVPWADSSGVTALLTLRRVFKHERRHLALVGLKPRVEYVLGITRVRPVFAVFATVAEAEDALLQLPVDGGEGDE